MSDTITIYDVGGYVRDRILGLKSKDRDFSVEAPSYEAMCAYVEEVLGAVIKEWKPEFLTIRAVHPTMGGVDYVMCRKDGAYGDGRRPDEVTPGTLMDDLARRDFTMNAIAMDGEGNYIDPFGGIKDISRRIIRCVGDTESRMAEDALRLIRAMRFSITKGFSIHGDIVDLLGRHEWAERLVSVDPNRIRDEFYKMFGTNTPATLRLLNQFPYISEYCFSETGIWLMPTTRKP